MLNIENLIENEIINGYSDIKNFINNNISYFIWYNRRYFYPYDLIPLTISRKFI